MPSKRAKKPTRRHGSKRPPPPPPSPDAAPPSPPLPDIPPDTPAPRAKPERGVLDLMRAIKSGEVAASSLSGDDRRGCVEHLTAEGYSVAEIASVLGAADRTIIRDRQRIREANALARDPALVGEMAGRLMSEADTAVTRVRRIARDKGATPGERLEAEKVGWTILRDLVATLQRLGYLPTAPMTVRADVGWSEPGGDDAADVEELLVETARLEAIALASNSATPPERDGCRVADRSPGASPGMNPGAGALVEIERVKDELLRIRLGASLARVSETLAKEGDNDGSEDDGSDA